MCSLTHSTWALVLRLTAMALLSVTLLLVKVAGQHGIPLFETIFWRQLMPVVLFLPYLAARGQLQRLRTGKLRTHAQRAMAGLLGMILVLGSVRLLPLAESTALSFTAPLFAIILAAILLKEKVGPTRWISVTLGLVGVLIIMRPHADATFPAFGLAVGLGGAFMVALTSIQLRHLGRTESPMTIVFWYAIFTAPLAAATLLWGGGSHSAMDWVLLVAMALCGFAGQLCLTASLRYGAVASVIIMDYSSLGWATLWGWLVFHNLPPVTTWIGAPIIMLAGATVVWRESRAARARALMAEIA